MEEKEVFKAHPAMLSFFIKPFLFILIIPFITALVQYILYRHIGGFLMLEGEMAALILLLSMARTKSFSITVEKADLIVKSGFIFKRTSHIKKTAVSSADYKQNLFDIILRCATFELNTEAGGTKKSDLSFKLGVSSAKRLKALLYSYKEADRESFSAFKVALLSASSSSLLTGAVALVPIINIIGRILGLSVGELISQRLNILILPYNRYFPETVNLITAAVLIIYGISFLSALLKNARFSLINGKNIIEIDAGLIVRRHTAFLKQSVNCLIVEQTPILRLFGLFTMSVSVAGYGGKRGKKPTIIPCAAKTELRKTQARLFPDLKAKKGFKARLSSIPDKSRFIILPIVIYICLLSAVAAVGLFFKAFLRLGIFLALVFAVINTYYLYISLFECKNGLLAVGDTVYAVGRRGLTVRKISARGKSIAQIRLIRTLADKRHGTCRVKIIIKGESAEAVRVRNIPYKEAKKLFSE